MQLFALENNSAGNDICARLCGYHRNARFALADLAVLGACALGENDKVSSRAEDIYAVIDDGHITCAARNGKSAELSYEPAEKLIVEKLLFRHIGNGKLHRHCKNNGVGVAAVVGSQNNRSVLRNILYALDMEIVKYFVQPFNGISYPSIHKLSILFCKLLNSIAHFRFKINRLCGFSEYFL